MPISTPGKSDRPKRPSKGLTLIELMVAMAIVGLIFAVAAASLRSVFDANLKTASSQLASTLRYLSNKAVTDHLTLKIVFDFEGQSYHVEETGDSFVISPEEEKLQRERSEEGPEEEKGGKEGVFSRSEARILKPVKLPSGVFFKDVSVSYLEEKRGRGEVSTYFFPDGYATATLINLRDASDEDHYSIELLPLSGQVKIAGEYRGNPTQGKP